MKKTRIIVLLTGAFLCICLLLAIGAARQAVQLDREISQLFDGKRWSLPAVLYARPLEIYPGRELSAQLLEDELELAGYRREPTVQAAGGYNRSGSKFQIITRDFIYPAGLEKSSTVSVTIENERITSLTDSNSGNPVDFLRVDPARIGSFHPLVHEDRLVLSPQQIPALLQETIIAVEDKGFFSHHGISISGIGRAFFTNLAAGKTVQGGST
ncbi:MAG: transglycosylase domain-containing protein, partial [Desulfocapsaceae bacterium]|nr:transglycosylase domain-containing protein [Desulfocapsaceae bacterium]